MDLVKSLSAHLDEEEADAWDIHGMASCGPDPGGGCTCGVPQQRLREVAAKRELIILYKQAWAAIGRGPIAVQAAALVHRDTLHRTLAILDAAYSDQQDCDPAVY